MEGNGIEEARLGFWKYPLLSINHAGRYSSLIICRRSVRRGRFQRPPPHALPDEIRRAGMTRPDDALADADTSGIFCIGRGCASIVTPDKTRQIISHRRVAISIDEHGVKILINASAIANSFLCSANTPRRLKCTSATITRPLPRRQAASRLMLTPSIQQIFSQRGAP